MSKGTIYSFTLGSFHQILVCLILLIDLEKKEKKLEQQEGDKKDLKLTN